MIARKNFFLILFPSYILLQNVDRSRKSRDVRGSGNNFLWAQYKIKTS